MLAAFLSSSAHRCGCTVLVMLALACAGCAAPSPENNVAAPADRVSGTASPDLGSSTEASAATEADAQPQTASHPRRAPRLDAPPSRSPVDPASVEIDRSCSSDAECTVKDVGNCCGQYPACVNVDSPTDPEGVRARCAESGMVSTCGFPVIASCQCVAGQCKGNSRAMLE